MLCWFNPIQVYWLDIPFCEATGLKGVNGTKHIFFIPESEWNKSHIERYTIMHIFPHLNTRENVSSISQSTENINAPEEQCVLERKHIMKSAKLRLL
ncbi:hypothetical protein GQ457_18G015920 [Hibiscus cannabinus]